MVKFSKHTSFESLKFANEVSTIVNPALMEEYKELIITLRKHIEKENSAKQKGTKKKT